MTRRPKHPKHGGSARADQWKDRSWNQDAGRVAWWIDRAQRSGTHTAKQAARMFFTMLLAEQGDVPARRMLAAQRVSIPAWLVALPVNQGEATGQPASIRIAA